MFYQPRLRNHNFQHDPFKALVAPRPIGWISSMSLAGAVNLAPYSYFNAFSTMPPIVGFASEGMKDSAFFAAELGEFVCNIVRKEDAQAMNATSAALPRGVSEFEAAGLAMEASSLVRPPRVKGIAAALECKTTQVIPLSDAHGEPTNSYLILGEVIGVYIDEAYLVNGRVDSLKMGQLARLGYMDYAAVEKVFSLHRS